MLKTAALFVVLTMVDGIAAQQNYCDLCSDHTMCIYKSPGPMCNPLLASGVSWEERQQILKVHNELRTKVATGRQEGQPPAANMRQMTWDDELATVAQRWADQCNYNHDGCRKVERFSVNQNAFEGSSSAKGMSPNWRATVESWFSEVKIFNRNQISPFVYSKPTAHYTQVVWAETNKVGCGFSQFPEGKWYQSFYVCNYGPSGNIRGGTMYKEGKPCTQCPPGTTLCRNKLCV